VRAIELQAALRKRPENLAAYDCTLRALHLMNSLDVKSFEQARELLSRAIAADPEFAMPVAWAARWYSLYVGQGWSSNSREDSTRAIELAAAAIDLDPRNALGLATYAHLRSYLFHDYDTALLYFDRALHVCPNHSLAWALSSATLSYVGRSDEAIAHAEHALELSPLDNSLFYYYNYLALAHYSHGNFSEAVKLARMSVAENPSYTATLRIFIAALVAHGDAEQAQVAAATLLSREPNFRISDYERTRQPFQPQHLIRRYIQHLRDAGLPS
jgi:adenylate cyclase